jgi:hypothetical protein
LTIQFHKGTAFVCGAYFCEADPDNDDKLPDIAKPKRICASHTAQLLIYLHKNVLHRILCFFTASQKVIAIGVDLFFISSDDSCIGLSLTLTHFMNCCFD